MQNYERFAFSRDYHKLMGLNNTQLDDRHSMAFLERRLEDERQKRQSEVIRRIEQEEVKRVRKLLMLGYITDKNETDYQDYFKATRGSARKTRRLSLSSRPNVPAPKTVASNDDDTEKAWKVKPHRPKPEDFRERNIMTYATPPKLPFLSGKSSPPVAANVRVQRHRTETPAYSPDCARYPIMSPRRLSVSEKPDEDDDDEDEQLKHTEQYTEKIFEDDADGDGDGSSLIEYLRAYDESLGKPSQADEGEPWWTWTSRKPKPPRSAIRFKYNGVSTIETRYIPPRTPEPVKDFLHTQTVADLYKEAEILVGRR